MTEIWRSESGLWPLALLALALGIVAFIVDYRRWRRRGISVSVALWRAGSDIIVAGNFALVAILTLTPGGTGRELNLIPFKEIADLWLHPTLASAPRVEIIGNFLLFVPAAAVLYARRRIAIGTTAERGRIAFRTVRTIGGIAAGIEVVQYLLALGRIASITDVLLPTIGASAAIGIVEVCLVHVLSRVGENSNSKQTART